MDRDRLGVSTSWNVDRCGTSETAIEEIASTGVGLVEIAVRAAVAERATSIRQRVDEERLDVASVTVTTSAGGLATALEPEAAGVVSAIGFALERATRLAAPVLVVDGGRFDVGVDVSAAMDAAIASGDVDRIQALTQEFEPRRLREREPACERLCRRLHDLTAATPIRVALRTSGHPADVLRADEMSWIVDDLGDRVAYWHDVGRSHLFASFGMGDGETLVDRLSSHLTGFYLSDVVGLEAGHPPGLGRLDWGAIRPSLSANLPAILKLEPGSDTVAVTEALRFLAG